MKETRAKTSTRASNKMQWGRSHMGWGGSDLELLHYYWIQPKAENLFPNVGWKHTLWANPLMLDHFLIF